MELDYDSFRLAHDIRDPTIFRSKDVELQHDITFEDFKLSNETFSGLKKCGFERPSPIQSEAIPLGRCGFDLVVQSKAGTGKTCIFGVIALEALQSWRDGTQSIIIVPTRGVKVDDNRKQLNKKNGQIVIGTPGRVKQLIELNILITQHIELFVLDEADKLMDEQFKTCIDEIYKRLPRDKQMIVTSATYPNELSIFLQQYMRLAKFVRVGTELSLEAVKEFYVRCKAGHSSRKTLENKLKCLGCLLSKKEYNKCFVFTNFQARAPIICESLNKDPEFVSKKGTTSYICAELSQEERSKIFHQFKKSKDQRILVSTDLSARGIDIQDAELVVNFDIPFDNETYFHRIGRAGRFGQPGTAITILTSEPMDNKQFSKSIKSDRINLLLTNDCDS